MKNDKLESPGIVEAISRFTGACVGTLVVGGKEIVNCINDMTKSKEKADPKSEIEPTQKLKPEPMPMPTPKMESKPSTKIAEKSIKRSLEKKSRPTAKSKKKTTSRQARVKKEAETK